MIFFSDSAARAREQAEAAGHERHAARELRAAERVGETPLWPHLLDDLAQYEAERRAEAARARRVMAATVAGGVAAALALLALAIGVRLAEVRRSPPAVPAAAGPPIEKIQDRVPQ